MNGPTVIPEDTLRLSVDMGDVRNTALKDAWSRVMAKQWGPAVIRAHLARVRARAQKAAELTVETLRFGGAVGS